MSLGGYLFQILISNSISGHKICTQCLRGVTLSNLFIVCLFVTGKTLRSSPTPNKGVYGQPHRISQYEFGLPVQILTPQTCQLTNQLQAIIERDISGLRIHSFRREQWVSDNSNRLAQKHSPSTGFEPPTFPLEVEPLDQQTTGDPLIQQFLFFTL